MGVACSEGAAKFVLVGIGRHSCERQLQIARVELPTVGMEMRI